MSPWDHGASSITFVEDALPRTLLGIPLGYAFSMYERRLCRGHIRPFTIPAALH
jgi:hypothetical protein